jgi:hypothetical protein
MEIERYEGDDFIIYMHRMETFGGISYAWACSECDGVDGTGQSKSRMEMNRQVDNHVKQHEWRVK